MLAFFCFFFLSLFPLHTLQDASKKDILIKAAIVRNILKYVEWPAHEGTRYHFTFVGKALIKPHLEKLLSLKGIKDKEFTIDRVATIEEIKKADVIYVSEDVHFHIDTIAKYQPLKHVLVLSEKEGTLESGALINLLIEDQKINFEINIERIKLSELYISSRFLKLAVNYRSGKPTE